MLGCAPMEDLENSLLVDIDYTNALKEQVELPINWFWSFHEGVALCNNVVPSRTGVTIKTIKIERRGSFSFLLNGKPAHQHISKKFETFDELTRVTALLDASTQCTGILDPDLLKMNPPGMKAAIRDGDAVRAKLCCGISSNSGLCRRCRLLLTYWKKNAVPKAASVTKAQEYKRTLDTLRKAKSRLSNKTKVTRF